MKLMSKRKHQKKYIMLLLNKSDYVMFDQTIDKLYNIAEKNNLLN